MKLFARFLLSIVESSLIRFLLSIVESSLIVVGFHDPEREEMTVGGLWRVDVPALRFADADRTLPCDR